MEAMAYIEDIVIHVLILLQAEDVIFLGFGGFGRGDLPTVIRRRLSSLKEVARNFRVSRAGATNDIIFTVLLVIMPHEKRFTCLCLISNHARSMPFHSAKTSQCDETSKRDNSVGKERKEKSFFFKSHMNVQCLSTLCCTYFFIWKTFFEIINSFHTEILNILVK